MMVARPVGAQRRGGLGLEQRAGDCGLLLVVVVLLLRVWGQRPGAAPAAAATARAAGGAAAIRAEQPPARRERAQHAQPARRAGAAAAAAAAAAAGGRVWQQRGAQVVAVARLLRGTEVRKERAAGEFMTGSGIHKIHDHTPSSALSAHPL